MSKKLQEVIEQLLILLDSEGGSSVSMDNIIIDNYKMDIRLEKFQKQN